MNGLVVSNNSRTFRESTKKIVDRIEKLSGPAVTIIRRGVAAPLLRGRSVQWLVHARIR